MRSPLCLIGIHRAVWTPALTHVTKTDTTWLQIRTCHHCRKPLGRRYQE